MTAIAEPSRRTHHAERGRVVVVGAGLAGITAALDCARGGVEVTLLESRPRLGGAAYSVHRNGLHVDNGQHVFLRCCTEYRDLLDRIGASDGVTLQEQLEIPVLAPGREPMSLRRDALPAPLHLARSLVGYGFLSVRERVAAAIAMQALGRVDPDDPANDERSFGDWLTRHRQSPRAIDRLWSLIARPTLNLVPADASLAQAAYVFQQGLLRDPAAGDIGWARVPLSSLHDVAVRKALAEADVDVHSSVRVEVVRPNGHGDVEIEVGGRPTVHADAVVVAVQHDRVSRLVPALNGIGAALRSLGSSPIVNLHVVYDRRVLDVPFVAGLDSAVQWVFDRTASAGIDSGQYLAVSLSAADEEAQMTGEELRERFERALAELLPAAREARIEQFFVMREHNATFRAAPGARAKRPGPQTGIPGLVLAGAYTDTGWPATMEGAVRSGRVAAGEALAQVRTLAAVR
jgi:squalene-associated FAD-dependent desaturase